MIALQRVRASMVLARIGVMGSTKSDYQWVQDRAAAEVWRMERVAEDASLARLPFSVLTEEEANSRRWQHGSGTTRFYPNPV